MSRVLRCGRFALELARPRVMGIVNITPDSFSDGGLHEDPTRAIAHAERLIADGADLVDVGAESTRPGAAPVDPDTEWARLAPVLAALRDSPVPISVDTRKPAVMRRALDAGAAMINDVAGFTSTEAIAAVAAADCAVCAMHMRGEPATMQADPAYPDGVVATVVDFLTDRAAALVAAGVATDRIVIDPGFGFGKTHEHNLELLRSLDRLTARGWPVLVGLSRKGTIGTLTGRPVDQRTAGSVAAALAAIAKGVAIVRVHDVAETVDALEVWLAAQDFPFAAEEAGSIRRTDGASGTR
jgi:dihydropteroate synthase